MGNYGLDYFFLNQIQGVAPQRGPETRQTGREGMEMTWPEMGRCHLPSVDMLHDYVGEEAPFVGGDPNVALFHQLNNVLKDRYWNDERGEAFGRPARSRGGSFNLKFEGVDGGGNASALGNAGGFDSDELFQRLEMINMLNTLHNPMQLPEYKQEGNGQWLDMFYGGGNGLNVAPLQHELFHHDPNQQGATQQQNKVVVKKESEDNVVVSGEDEDSDEDAGQKTRNRPNRGATGKNKQKKGKTKETRAAPAQARPTGAPEMSLQWAKGGREVDGDLRFKLVKGKEEAKRAPVKDQSLERLSESLPEGMRSLLPPSLYEQLLRMSQEYAEKLKKNPQELLSSVGLPRDLADVANSTLFGLGGGQNSQRKIGTLTVGERKVKIEKYLQKRKNRSWNKKISYDCRKRVADARLRIKGRFVTRDQAVVVLGISLEEINRMSTEELTTLIKAKFGELTPGKKREKKRLGQAPASSFESPTELAGQISQLECSTEPL